MATAAPSVCVDDPAYAFPSCDRSLESFARCAEPARRCDLRHGRALEVLGHAVEYLIDSRVVRERPDQGGEHLEAVHLLMRLSREIFLECPEVVPLWTRVRRRLKGSV